MEISLISATDKKNSLLEYENKTRQIASIRKVWEETPTLEKIKIIISVEIKEAVTFPYRIRSSFVYDEFWTYKPDIVDWLSEKGYSLEVDWQDTGNNDIIHNLIVSFND